MCMARPSIMAAPYVVRNTFVEVEQGHSSLYSQSPDALGGAFGRSHSEPHFRPTLVDTGIESPDFKLRSRANTSFGHSFAGAWALPPRLDAASPASRSYGRESQRSSRSSRAQRESQRSSRHSRSTVHTEDAWEPWSPKWSAWKPVSELAIDAVSSLMTTRDPSASSDAERGIAASSDAERGSCPSLSWNRVSQQTVAAASSNGDACPSSDDAGAGTPMSCSDTATTRMPRCHLLWCDHRAFKDSGNALKDELERASHASVRTHKTAQNLTKLLKKKQHAQGRPPCVILVSWANAPALLSFFSETPSVTAKVVVLCDARSCKKPEEAEALQEQFPFIGRIAKTWEDAVELACEAVAAFQSTQKNVSDFL